jgi:D-alanyl-D-alanine carboxypeptidase-like protein
MVEDRSTTRKYQFRNTNLFNDVVAQRIVGKSWEPACPIPLKDLRYLTMSYWGYDDQEHLGEMVVHKDVAEEVVAIFEELFYAQFPIERMQLIDDFFEPGKTKSEIDDISMAHNNSYGFFFRYVSKTTIVSEHGMGTAIDINPLVNPFVRGDYVRPTQSREYSNRRRTDVKGLITEDTVCYKAFIKRGWNWAGQWKKIQDYQHFCKVQTESVQ